MERYINLFFSIYLNVVILFIFLTIFFWVRKSNTVGKNIYNELENSIKNFHISNQIIKDGSIKYLQKYYEGQNAVVERTNKQLFKINIAFILLLLFGLISVIFVKYKICGKGFNWLQVISENLLILIIAGSIECYFFLNIVNKYNPIMPSYLQNAIKTEFDKLLLNH